MIPFETPADYSVAEDDESCFDLDSGELLLGDIMISAERAAAQAEEYGHSPMREYAFLIAHSVLHLTGYDHMEDEERLVMEKKQREVLEMLGNFLKKQFREQDVIGRIGGDEFVILLYNIGSRQNMENRVKSLQEKIREIHMDGMEGHTFTLSAGIAFAPQDGDTFMELYQKADLALYQVKRSGRNGYRIYK